MDNKKVFLVKCKTDIDNSATKKILEYAEKSLEKKEKGYYNLRESEKITYDTNKNYIMMVSYNADGKFLFDSNGEIEKCQIDTIYIGTARLVKKKDDAGKYNIKYKMKKRIDDPYVIINLLDEIDCHLVEDYEEKSYVKELSMKILIRKIKDVLIEPTEKSDKSNYETVEADSDKYDSYKLSEFAQHNDQSIRLYNEQKPQDDRSEFQRDRERIVNSRSFRRLVDKAQIFSAEKGDHYRTRMTHTLEVNQIAKAIAMALNLNLDLTEAIALGHDIGHTPFGHQGERTLKDILTDNIAENFHIKNIDSTVKNILGGFKHNIQSVRVLSKIEEKYVGCSGLDVSVQVLEGILKHTKVKDVDLSVLLDENLLPYLYSETPFSTTLEGQAVAIADEIAQRGHDIDDAISSGLISSVELLDCLEPEKFSRLQDKLKKQEDQVDACPRVYTNEQELLASRFVSTIVGYFINDVIDEYKEKALELGGHIKAARGQITEKIIDFSVEGKTICNYLEKVVNKRVINNAEVASFDFMGGEIIKKLFFTYYKNPRLLHYGTLRRVYADVMQHDDYEVAATAIDLSNGNLDVIKHEIKWLTIQGLDYNKIDENKVDYIYWEKRKILIRNIVDYISGMTDSYAKLEYEKFK